jgi:putative tryptophan/tyrosine transport system substrate-binding protein
MIPRRRVLIAIGAGLSGLLPSVSFAQQPRVRRIGFLAIRSRSTATNPDPYYDAFVQGMRELGYVEGKNLVIEWRFAEGNYERLAGLAANLVRAEVEVIVSHGTEGTRAAQRASSIPVVTAAVGHPVAGGFAASLARPGGNVTGLSTITSDLAQKHVELLKTLMPALSRVAILMNFGNSNHAANLKLALAAGEKLGIAILPVDARTPEGIERGFATMTREGAEAFMIDADPFYTGQRKQFAALAMTNRIPSMAPYREYVEAGSLMSYGPDVGDFFRYAATFVDKILKGAQPGDLPFEQPTRYYLVINRKTANALNLKIPLALLTLADALIE